MSGAGSRPASKAASRASDEETAPTEPITYYSKPSREEEAATTAGTQAQKAKMPPELLPLVQRPFEGEDEEEEGEGVGKSRAHPRRGGRGSGHAQIEDAEDATCNFWYVQKGVY